MYKSLNICDFTPKEEIETRLEGLRKRMALAGINFAVILQNVDLFYFTGTVQKGILIVPVDGPPLFFVEKSLYRAGIESPLEIVPIKKDKDIGSILSGKNIIKGKGGMELDILPVTLFERWKSILSNGNIADVSPLIKEVRLIKSEFEIAQIIKSGKILSHVFQKAEEIIQEGMREIEIDAALVAEMRRMNHQGFLRMRGFNQEMMCGYVTQGYSATITSNADVPISGLGLSPAIGQGSSVNIVKKGTPVIVDFGGGYNGYITDETRVYAVGELKDIFLKGYQVSREIVEEAMSFAREGVDATELFLRALERAKEAKLEQYFMGHGEGQVSFVGHGLGLEINELPVFTPRHKTILKEGMVFAFEPKFIIPNEGAVGIEVDFIVRKDGLQRVTDSPIDIVYV
jgi:Xaa-Pro aminopeptidase